VSSIQRFEDLIAWQKAFDLTERIYHATRSDSFAHDYGLTNQMQRAAVSIMSNIAEGFERANPGDFHRFLSIAKGSCAELRSQLYIAQRVGYLSDENFQELMSLTVETGKVIGGLRVSVEQRWHGTKRK